MIGYGKIQIAYENIFHVNSFCVAIRAKARQIGLLLRRVADLARPIAGPLGLRSPNANPIVRQVH